MEGGTVRHLLLVDAHGQVKLVALVQAEQKGCWSHVKPPCACACLHVCAGADPGSSVPEYRPPGAFPHGEPAAHRVWEQRAVPEAAHPAALTHTFWTRTDIFITPAVF